MICYIGVYGEDFDGNLYLMCEVLGGGLGGCLYGDGEDMIYVVLDSCNLLIEFIESWFLFCVELLGFVVDFGGLGLYCGGLGYDK